MRVLVAVVFTLAGAGFSSWLSDRCITAEERSISLFAPVCCAACGRRREAWDRVPLLSWLLNGGKCRFCGAALSKREPLITFCTIAVWMIGLGIWMPSGSAYTLTRAVAASALLCAAGLCWIGASERLLLLPILICTGTFGVLLSDGVRTSSHLIGMTGMAVFGLALRFLPVRVRGRDRLRLDTIVYLGLAGLMLGWQNCFTILPAAVITAAGFMLLKRRTEIALSAGKNKGTVRADPANGHLNVSLYLTVAAVLSLLFGRPLMDWYLRLFAQIG